MKVFSKAVVVAIFMFVGVASGQGLPLPDPAMCGDLRNHYGPFDYRTQSMEQRDLVERHHFTTQVEQLRAGESTAVIGSDINYTLNVFPNHPRALQAMSRLALREKRAQPAGADYTIDCYFERAIRFQPSDPGPYLVYGLHLARSSKPKQAVQALTVAAELSPADANVHYNLGLAYLEVKEYDNALKHAKIAYEAGFPLDGLRNRLKQAGKWK
jgi:predicted Zn-dependent protease